MEEAQGVGERCRISHPRGLLLTRWVALDGGPVKTLSKATGELDQDVTV